jgi:type II secretory pathway pseudopilin PulG
MVRGSERGFTLLELIVVTGFLIGLAGLAAFLLRPANHITERTDGRRHLAVAAIVQGVNRYIDGEHELPAYLPDKKMSIGTGNEEYDICLLTSVYLPEAPLDPEHGIAADAEGKTIEAAGSVDCNELEATYKAGFEIEKRRDYVIVSATLANGKTFELSSEKLGVN